MVDLTASHHKALIRPRPYNTLRTKETQRFAKRCNCNKSWIF
ncbi:hypothetical protein Golob_023727 [Gossypium lobatum]|uniref:Uncharacterized protein n=1 Tax=Gossypium lobatum TaxID=34289 RepID=A0A7J8LKI3_9ROSI|nr:hypothetical protein [Gossypium lobatum]